MADDVVYRTKAGVVVPRVSHILAMDGADHEADMDFAARMERRAVHLEIRRLFARTRRIDVGFVLEMAAKIPGLLYALLSWPEPHWREVFEAAGRIGTFAHKRIEARLLGTKPDLALASTAEMRASANALEAWIAWSEQYAIEPVVVDGVKQIEQPLVSERLRYGGTPDLVAYIDGALTLCDWKTSSAIRPRYTPQLEAYAAAWDELYPSQPIQQRLVLRLNKDQSFTSEPVRWIAGSHAAQHGLARFLVLRSLYMLSHETAPTIGAAGRQAA